MAGQVKEVVILYLSRTFHLHLLNHQFRITTLKPLIGINVDIQSSPNSSARMATIPETYIKAIIQAGGTPILLAPMPDDALLPLLKALSGVLLIGGPDYDPGVYGEKPITEARIADGSRQDFDMRLASHALADFNMRILGVCAGMQLLNIVRGGSLIQDIPSELPETKVSHVNPDSEKQELHWHQVQFDETSKLAAIFGKSKIQAVSAHHQAIRNLGDSLCTSAHAPDGIIEAVEIPERQFALGVQWHPERDPEGSARLFNSFVLGGLESAA